MRLNKREAEDEAIRIAKSFVATNGRPEWKCMGAKPDVIAAGFKRRKNVIKWAVLFEISDGGKIFEGPAVVLVNIETGAAEFF
jgi:hypothetical protein